MDRVEYEALVQAQARHLEQITSQTRFTARILCRMHRDWLGSIYRWAGEYRSVDIEKGDFRWPPAYRVARNMEVLEKGLLLTHTPCRPGPVGEVARQMAEVHAELLLIHPFREGNGRLARWLADLMAYQAGFPAPSPAYGFAGRGSPTRKQRYLEAVRKGYQGREACGDLAAFFAEALGASLRKAANR
jgi:cell filamentation protein